MIHAAHMHSGQSLSAEEADFFASLGRGTCRSCGFIRASRSRRCPRCPAGTPAAPPRRVQAGDIIIPSIGALVRFMHQQSDETMSVNEPQLEEQIEAGERGGDANEGHSPPSNHAATSGEHPSSESMPRRSGPRRHRWRPPDGLLSFRAERREPVTRQHRGPAPTVPEGFLEAVRRLRCGSVTHVPKSQRDRLTAWYCDCLEGSLDGEEVWGQLHEAFTKLLFASIPSGIPTDVEIASRLDMWEAGRLTDLVTRAQEQQSRKKETTAAALARKQVSAAQARAERLAKENAKSKACQSLLGGVKSLSPDEQRQWSSKLFPRAASGRRTHAPAPPSADASANAPPVTPPVQAPEAQQSPNENSSSDPLDGHPLKGISFPPMSGPGPSGTRPEHVKDMLGTSKRALRTRLLKLLDKAIEMGIAGTLPNSCRWILGTAATFLTKPGKDTPRPIRCGEWLRKVIAKVLLRRYRGKIRKRMLELMQFGVQMPGGCEALYHARQTIEECAARGELGEIAVVDVDMANFFGSVEWQPMLEAYAELFPEGLSWETWTTEQENHVTLPCGDRLDVDRGAGQGEPDGPLKASLTLGKSARAAHLSLRAEDVPSAHCWFIDDGQLFCRPSNLDKVLQRYDSSIENIGASRGRRSAGADIKSTVRVFSGSGETQGDGEWCTSYVRDSCLIRDSSTPCKLLGGGLGSADQQAAIFSQAVEKTSHLHDAISGINDPATQMALRLACGGVGKVGFLLRLSGDRLSAGDLGVLDRIQRDGVGTTLEGDVGDNAWEQALVAITSGGLGIGDAEELALPAFVASRVAARPVAERIFKSLEEEGLAPEGHLLANYDRRSNAAVDRLLEAFAGEEETKDAIQSTLRRALVAAEAWWATVEAGGEPSGANLIGEEADDDESASLLKSLHSAFAIQHSITKHFDRRRLRRLHDLYEESGEVEDVKRLEDLQDTPNQDHTWWQALNPQTDRVLPPQEWVTAMRIRLGASLTCSDRVCACCGAKVMDMQGYHALCCANAESTIGHNRVRDCLGVICSSSDPATDIEVPGLCPRAPTLRPADVLTRAFHPTLVVAADVGVRAPHAADAGDNPLDDMRIDKLQKYEDHREDLAVQGIKYEPVIFSAYGRRHPKATDMIKFAASRAARRRGWSNIAGLLKWWHRQLAAELWRRAARMAHACTPKTSEYHWLGDHKDDMEDEDVAVPNTATLGAWLVG